MHSSRTETLLTALTQGAPLRRHILTVLTTNEMSTEFHQHDSGHVIEYSDVIEHLATTITDGNDAAVVLRSFTDGVSHTLTNGPIIPVKRVCGWVVHGGAFYPLEAKQMSTAFHPAAVSGEIIPPEKGVEIVDAWTVDLTEFRALPSDGG